MGFLFQPVDRGHLFCPALLGSNPTTATHSWFWSHSRDTHWTGSCKHTHTHTLNIFTSADMMHAAFLLLFAFTGKTLCCRCMIFQFFFSRVRDRKVLVITSIVLHSVYIWCVNYLIPSKCCHRVTSVQIYLKPKMVKSVHLFFSFIVFSEAEEKPVVHLKEEKQKLSSYCSIYT